MSDLTPEGGPPKGPSGGGVFVAYTVEARCTLRDPKQVGGDFNLGQGWQGIHFRSGSKCGVPNGYGHDHMLAQVNMYSYATAEALRWWFLADLSSRFEDIGIETRLVKHRCKYSYSTEREEEFATRDSRMFFPKPTEAQP